VDSAARQPLAADTPFEVEEVQIAMWRRMTPADKVELVSSMCRAAQEAAIRDVQIRYPQAGAREQFLRLAILRLGYDLALEAFPDAAGLEP
jgi:hypothetical protein